MTQQRKRERVRTKTSLRKPPCFQNPRKPPPYFFRQNGHLNWLCAKTWNIHPDPRINDEYRNICWCWMGKNLYLKRGGSQNGMLLLALRTPPPRLSWYTTLKKNLTPGHVFIFNPFSQYYILYLFRSLYYCFSVKSISGWFYFSIYWKNFMHERIYRRYYYSQVSVIYLCYIIYILYIKYLYINKWIHIKC